MTTTREVQTYLQSCDLSTTRMSTVSKHLSLSCRALQLRLSGEGTTFTQLFDAERKWRCEGGLSRNKCMEASRLAKLCGYTQRESFYRAFKNWHGESLRQWREGVK